MIRERRGELEFYRFGLLSPHPELRHGVFTRKGGKGPLGLNLSFGQGGDPGEAAFNLALAEEALGLPPAAQVGQTHGAAILALRPGQAYAPRTPRETLTGYDAIIGHPGQSMLIKLADCQGVLIYSPRTRALALAHSGWRGSAKNIIGLTVKAMQRDYGADPRGLLAAVSPSIGPCCFHFRDWEALLPPEAWPYRLGDGDRFDFWALSRRQLEDSGLRPENIETADVCTRCSPDFFSHRRGDNGRFGILAGVMP